MHRMNPATTSRCIAGLLALASALLSSGCTSGQPAADRAGAEARNEHPTEGQTVECVSLLGRPLYRTPLSPAHNDQLLDDLADAEASLAASPADEDAAIWVGRRLAYLGRFNDSVDHYTAAIRLHPESYKLLRHRGHRFITLRRFDDAIADLSRARSLMAAHPDEAEPDGMPNAAGIPRSTSHSNILYHLALAHYLKGEFERAAAVYTEYLARPSINDDMLCATTHWAYTTFRRLGRDRDAARLLEPIHARMDVIENHAYHRLLLMYKGELTPEEVIAQAEASNIDAASAIYGVARWHYTHGRRDDAERLLQRLIDTQPWPAFGVIAAEADLARER